MNAFRLLYSLAVLLVSVTLFHGNSYAAHGFAGDSKILALVQQSSPKYFLNAGEKRGLCGDIYKHLFERLSSSDIHLKISNHFTPIKRILEALDVEATGIFCGASRTKEREERFTYSSLPLYQVSNILVTHRDNHEIPNSIDALMQSKATVGTYFGTGSSEFLKKTGVVRVNDKYKSVEKGLQSVAAGEVDYFFYHDLGLLYSLSILDLPLHAVPTIFRSYPHWMIFSKTMPAPLQKMIDAELTDMIQTGVIEKIWNKYKPAAP